MKKLFTLFLAAFLLHVNIASAATSQWKENETSGARTRIIASFYKDEQGQTKLITGVEFKLPQGWKIYGQGSEGIGVPPSISFKDSPNYLNHEITWPKAEDLEEKIGSDTYKYSAYHDDVILPVAINLKEAAQTAELTLAIDYGLCKDVCIPVSETFSLKIPNASDAESLKLIQKFYPQKILPTQEIIAEPEKTKTAPSIWRWVFAAIIGGAILNIMPCVLPVLSIKLLSIIDHLDAKISRIRFAFFSTICGIILCFFVFAIFAALIQYAGNAFGWGLQFQNPYFLIFLVIILVLFIANLLGVFEISFDQFVVNFLNKKITDSNGKKNIFIPNFLSGILAVLLATPCSAPILGSAISFALTQKIYDVFLIFCAIGTGFSLPYIVLLIAPKLIFFLPKPGVWMLKVKKLMALLLGVTVIWLAYILSHNIGMIPALSVTILVLLLLACFEIKSKFIKIFAFIGIIAVAFAIPSQCQAPQEVQKNTASIWIPFDERELYQLLMHGKVVVIDVTADWCLTCKVNKLRVLNSEEIVEKLSGENIVTMRADITKPNEEVMNFLRKHNRFAIPFNAVYGPSAKGGLLTSEFLTKKQLLELIDKAQ